MRAESGEQRAVTSDKVTSDKVTRKNGKSGKSSKSSYGVMKLYRAVASRR